MLYDKWKPFCFIKFEIIKNGIYRNAKENYMFTFDLRRKGCTAQHIIHTTLHTHILDYKVGDRSNIYDLKEILTHAVRIENFVHKCRTYTGYQMSMN